MNPKNNPNGLWKIFVDGREGTTGLQIDERLKRQAGIELLEIPEALRKDPEARRERINAADLAFLCLPDAASREAVSLIDPLNDRTRVIDSSTAFRTAPGWVYGFPELEPGQREKIRFSRRVAVPGCHATGFTALVHPLRRDGYLPADYPLSCQSISGYSGGGKKLIAKYGRPAEELAAGEREALRSPQLYSLGLTHKHLPEMAAVNALAQPPVFTPAVADYYQGMLVVIPLHRGLLGGHPAADELRDYYRSYYKDERFISVLPADGLPASGYLDATGCNGTNRLEILVLGRDDQLVLIARLDNLGKGASGAAVQCMNLLLGRDEGAGLE
jgi:N-acetyl-gamma-glutamyl-phosphate reductase